MISPWHSNDLTRALQTSLDDGPAAGAELLHQANDTAGLELCYLTCVHLLAWYWQDTRARVASALVQDDPEISWADIAAVTGHHNAGAARRLIRQSIDSSQNFISTARPRLHSTKITHPADIGSADSPAELVIPESERTSRVRQQLQQLRSTQQDHPVDQLS